ncbi:MAG: flavin reductase family protein [Candidatus Caenarcaniphilales bacterium]|jgi:3-hydroxy-9,10-secoandrosta-1,3,5(10)-triene-9,17-dione monooxygenase reductase component|nr:flavin reductase family protein [Candidatus Caenarcaniphilales bacterium]
MDKSQVAPILGKIVAGLYIISLKQQEKEMGFLASWVQQAGFEPPMLTIAFNKERKEAFSLLSLSGHLVVNIMAKENSKTMSRFFKPAPETGSIFDELETFKETTGIPILKDSLGFLECKYKSEMISGDHIIVLCEIINGKLLNTELQPSTHIRPDGFKY